MSIDSSFDTAEHFEEQSEQQARTHERQIDKPGLTENHRAQSLFDGLWRQEPWVLAVVGIALGAAIGAAFPASVQEKKILADLRQKIGSAGDRTELQGGTAGADGSPRTPGSTSGPG